jgi:hypothetical protein
MIVKMDEKLFKTALFFLTLSIIAAMAALSGIGNAPD